MREVRKEGTERLRERRERGRERESEREREKERERENERRVPCKEGEIITICNYKM